MELNLRFRQSVVAENHGTQKRLRHYPVILMLGQARYLFGDTRMWLHEYITEETPNLLRVNDDTNDFTFEMYGQAPVQAFGEVAGREFYFRARHNEWSCEVAGSDGLLPSDGSTIGDGFIREEKYKLASYMSLREALKIIDRCMSEYFNRLSP